MKKADQNKLDYIAEWHRVNTKIIPVRLNIDGDKDIIDKLETVPSKGGYIKELIRKDIKNGF